jgi:hypothetical protein
MGPIDRVIAIALAAVFALFAWFQLNDPNPLGWTLIYGAGSLLWVAAAVGWRSEPLTLGLIMVIGPWMVFLFPGIVDLVGSGDLSQLFGTLRMDRPYIEESREFLGLGILAASLLWHLREVRTDYKKSKKPE